MRPPDALIAFLRRSVDLARLEPGWDSYGAVAIDRDCIGEAIRVYLAMPQDDWALVPCSDGGVQLERHADGLDFEFTISPASREGGR